MAPSDVDESSLVVRALEPDEWRVHRDVRLAALSTDPAAFSSTHAGSVGLPESDWRSRCDNRSWFAFRDGRPVGMVRLALDDDPVEVISMWVDPGARRHGVARALLQTAMAAASAHGDLVALWVVDDNLPAIELYRALGFVDTGATEEQPDGRVELKMVAPLRAGVPITRRAAAPDVDAFIALRALMFEAMHVPEPDPVWRPNAAEWFVEHVDDPLCGMVVVEVDGQVVASAMGQVREAMPSPAVPEGGDVLVNNVCVLPEFRGQGHGRRAFDAVMAWARTTGVHRVELMATPDGRPMYERSGFTATAQPCMRLLLEEH